MKRLAIAVVSVLAVSASPQQEKPASTMLWAKTWKDALEEAVIRNVPIYYTVHKDG